MGGSSRQNGRCAVACTSGGSAATPGPNDRERPAASAAAWHAPASPAGGPIEDWVPTDPLGCGDSMGFGDAKGSGDPLGYGDAILWVAAMPGVAAIA